MQCPDTASQAQHYGNWQAPGVLALVRVHPPHKQHTQDQKTIRSQPPKQQRTTPRGVLHWGWCVSLLRVFRHHKPLLARVGWAKSDALEHQGTVGATKAKVVFDRYIDFHVTGHIGTVVQIALWILLKDIDGGRYFLLM